MHVPGNISSPKSPDKTCLFFFSFYKSTEYNTTLKIQLVPEFWACRCNFLNCSLLKIIYAFVNLAAAFKHFEKYLNKKNYISIQYPEC